MAVATASPLTTTHSWSPINYCRNPTNKLAAAHRTLRIPAKASSPSSLFPLRPPSKAVAGHLSKPVVASAYVSGPAFDAIVAENNEFKVEDGSQEPEDEAPEPAYAISWGLVWGLISGRSKIRLLVCVLTVIGCSTCTLAMPLYSGRFFEVLVGRSSESLLMLLSKIALFYTLEPIFTVIFIANMNAIWEKVMSSLRAQIFQRVLIQKVEFFDHHKVGELTSLLTSDLGTLKNIVSENVSRDRGFRALSEVVGTMCLLFFLSPQLAPILGFLMLTVSTFVGKIFMSWSLILC